MDTLSKLSPIITNMIRIDHTHVMSIFHQYESMLAAAGALVAGTYLVRKSMGRHA